MSSTDLPFADRRAAGRALAEVVRSTLDDHGDVIVLALPRGGVPVAYEVALALDAPLDVFVVRKLGVPGHEELAMGAIASGGTVVTNERVITDLRIGERALAAVVDAERSEVSRRERAYRGDRPPPVLAGRTAVLVDDGLATGASMRAAVHAVRSHNPARIVVAVPVASPSTVEGFRREVDAILTVATPASFYAVGQAYRDFTQTTDDEVRDLLSAP